MIAIAVTGASGFIGQALSRKLLDHGHTVYAAVRYLDSTRQTPKVGLKYVAVGDIGANTDWSDTLSGVDCVIHCAARAHVTHETESDALATYRVVNVEGTRNLAQQAAASGVKRLIYLSSIKVNGEWTNEGEDFTHDNKVRLETPYAISKWEAEQALWEASACTGLEVVVIRPPLVYGPRVKGNFLRLLKLIASGIPLPLGAVNNQRSLVGLDNLVDLLIRCIYHPAAAGQTFLASDGCDLSTSDLVRKLARALNKSPYLLPVPVSLLRWVGRIAGKAGEIERLIGSLQIDISHTREVLGWTPPLSVDEGLQKTAEWYLSQRWS